MIENLLARGRPFLLLRKSAFQQQAEQWKDFLPNVRPFYAMKCNDQPALLNWVRSEGWGFDCASLREIRTAQSLFSDILYANPVKNPLELEQLRRSEHMVTLDSLEEAKKLKALDYKGPVLLRIAVDDSDSLVRFSDKFGARIADIEQLSKNRLFTFAGISFHVGGLSKDPYAFYRAIMSSHQLLASKRTMFSSHPVLDIGGGFPGVNERFLFQEQSTCIKDALHETRFAQVFAEPGRYFATTCGTAYVPIIGKRRIGGVQCYTLDESVYGLFNNVMFDHFKLADNISVLDGAKDAPTEPTRLFGRTCDGLDVLGDVALPADLPVGTFLKVNNMGGYSSVAQSEFNGFPKSEVYVDELH